MSSHDRRAAARRRAWGRGPMILKFEPLEGRQLLAAAPKILPDLVPQMLATQQNIDWGDTFTADGTVLNLGGSATTSDFKVDFFASPSPTIGPSSVYLGSADIPAGIISGSSANFTQTLTLPATAIPGSSSTGVVFIDERINHAKTVVESNYRNDQGNGQGIDVSPITITPQQPAALIGTAIGLSPNSVTWGSTFTVTAQVTNDAAGNAPPTRARIVLTPQGLIPGGTSDVTIDSMAIPAISAFQTVNVVHTVTLPDLPPSSLLSSTQYTLTLVQDADFLTNQSLANQTAQGLGFDQAVLTILQPTNSTAVRPPQPDLAPATVVAPAGVVNWGQTIQVATSVQNLGPGDVGPFRVRFLLDGVNGALSNSIFLADAMVPGLAAGASQPIIQTLKIPGRLPNGLQVNGTGQGRILVWVDPENAIDETLKTNNVASSAPMTLRLQGTGGTTTVPTQPSGNPVVSAPSATTPTKSKPLNVKLKTNQHGLKLVESKLHQFVKNLGVDLRLSKKK